MNKELFKKEISDNAILWYDFKENGNLLVIREDVGEITFSNTKFDTIIIKDYLKQIENVQKYLKPDGIILFLANNKNGLANSGKSNTYTKAEIERYLKKLKITNYKFYYPLSNYEQANTIFSDDYLPKYNNSKLLNNVFYDDDTVIKYNEIEAIKIVTKAGKFTDYTNSFIVEIGNKSPINLVSFNNARKEEYRLVTKVYKDKVVKEAVNEKSKNHIEQIKDNIVTLQKAGFNMLDQYENGKIISKFVEGKTLYDEIVELILNRKIDEAYKSLDDWYKYIKEKCQNMQVTYIDLVLENTFYRNSEYLFFDQEWKMEGVPLEFILYRTINNIYIYNPEVSSIVDKQAFFDKFDLVSQLEDMQKYEHDLQNKVVDLELAKQYDKEYREKYINTIPFEFYIKENLIQKIVKKLKN